MADDRFVAADADVVKGAGDGGAEISEVLRAGAALHGHDVDAVGALFRQDRRYAGRDGFVVDADRREGDDVQIVGAAVGQGDGAEDVAELVEDVAAFGFVIRPQRSF